MEETTIEIPSKIVAEVHSAPTTKITTTLEISETSLTKEIVIEEKKCDDEVKPQEKQKQEEEEGINNENQTSSHAQSLSHLLPPHSYAQISPRCYLFSGAEVTLDNMEEDDDDEDSDESDESEVEPNEFSDEEEVEEEEVVSDETRCAANEIIVPDIDNCQVPMLSCEIPVPEVSPTPSASSVSSPARSQLECGDRETVETIDANIHNNHDDDDLEPAPLKKPKLDIESIF